MSPCMNLDIGSTRRECPAIWIHEWRRCYGLSLWRRALRAERARRGIYRQTRTCAASAQLHPPRSRRNLLQRQIGFVALLVLTSRKEPRLIQVLSFWNRRDNPPRTVGRMLRTCAASFRPLIDVRESSLLRSCRARIARFHFPSRAYERLIPDPMAAQLWPLKGSSPIYLETQIAANYIAKAICEVPRARVKCQKTFMNHSG